MEFNVFEHFKDFKPTTDGPVTPEAQGTSYFLGGPMGKRIRNNEVVCNNTFGVAITQNPLGSPDQIPNGHQVRLNVVVDNGTKASNGLPGADLFYDGSGQDNCFARNRFTTSVPPNIEASFPCH